MRRLVIAAIIAIATIGLCATEYFYSGWLAEEITTSVNEASEKYKDGDKEFAEKKLSDIKDEWETHQEYIAVFLSHDTLESVSVTIEMAQEYLLIDDDHFLIECTRLVQQLDHIKGTEMLKISNIL